MSKRRKSGFKHHPPKYSKGIKSSGIPARPVKYNSIKKKKK